ncbi:glycosyltransferase family 2 protein [Nafulsella turpanensis]|uniref:glycosyltransferase family 2 protein n=1 Tax=Nafulsella turpanensis TaxID=1265690 RepID=UPI00034D8850|nr:glycosyltransferase family 2 protein [Nafulsella turpanensis]
MLIDVIIPAFNEEKSIGKVLADMPWQLVREVVVTDNASKDKTTKVARAAGATVLYEGRKGYGWACLKAMDYIAQKEIKPDIVVFMDGDYADNPQQLPEVVAPILAGQADLVIGSRALGRKEKGSLTPQQRFGNWLATYLLRRMYNTSFTDLGPFRAVRYQSLLDIQMQDKTYGWTVEMQAKAARLNLRCTEVPVNYRRRIGVSKVSGTVKGTLGAGYKILWTIFKYR